VTECRTKAIRRVISRTKAPTIVVALNGDNDVTAHIVSTVLVTDPARFKSYVEAIAGLAESFGGDYVIRGGCTELLEGAGVPGQRWVVLRFPDGDAARRFYHSATYQSAKALRAGAADLTMLLFES
jgi:uncharacterized protein (DUF1330 family)